MKKNYMHNTILKNLAHNQLDHLIHDNVYQMWDALFSFLFLCDHIHPFFLRTIRMEIHEDISFYRKKLLPRKVSKENEMSLVFIASKLERA